MLGSTRQVAVWCFNQPVDMRKSFDGLYALVRDGFGRDPMSGDLFVFVGRDRRRAKVLHWDGTGLCVYAKRLESSKFAAPWKMTGETTLRLTATELALFLEGSELVGKVALSPPEFRWKSS